MKPPSAIVISKQVISKHTFRWLLITVLASVWLSGCGSDDDDTQNTNTTSSPPVVTTTQSQSATLDATGGAVELTITNGTRFLLEVPIGALAAEHSISLTSRPTVSGQYFNLLLQPDGLIFESGTPIALTIALPDGVSLPSTGGLAYAGAPVPFEVLENGHLRVELTSFSEASDTSSMASGLRAQTVRAAAIACGDAPTASLLTEDGLVAVDHIEAELYGQCMVGAINALVVNEQYALAIQAADAVAAYLQRVNSGDPTVHLQLAQTAACLGYRAALDRALETTVNSMGTLYEVSRPILFWETIVQRLGASCEGIASNEFQTVIHTKTSEAIAYYEQQTANLTNTQSSDYLAARQEARESLATEQQVLALSPPSVVIETVQDQVVERAQVSLLDALLQAPWDACRVGNNFDALITLMNELDAPDAVRAAAHYCGVQLNAISKDASDETVATLSSPLGGVSAGLENTSGSLSVASDGTLELSGPILTLGCPAGYSGTESLELNLNGTPIQTLVTGNYLVSSLTLQVADLLSAAGILPENFSQATLTLERTGNPCNGFWGEAPSPLLTLTLSKAGVCAPASGESFCLTQLAPVSPSLTFNVVGPNDRGEVVLRHFSKPHERWYRGSVTALPTDFRAVGIDNAGNIAGNILWQPDPNFSFLTNAVVIPAGSNTSTVLKSSIAPTCSASPCPDMSSVGINSRLMSISPNGRVLIHTEQSSRVANGADSCLFETATNTYYCQSSIWESAEYPGYALSTAQSNSLPDPLLNHTVYWDGDDQGIVGRVTQTTTGLCNGSVCGTSTNTYAMHNLEADTSQPSNGYAYVDTRGNRVLTTSSTPNTPNTLQPSNAYLPSGWFVYAMGTHSDALICSGVYTGSNTITARMINLHTGVVTAEGQLPWIISLGGVAQSLSLCSSGASTALLRMDRYGRFTAPVTNGTGTTMVIVTPVGKPSP